MRGAQYWIRNAVFIRARVTKDDYVKRGSISVQDLGASIGAKRGVCHRPLGVTARNLEFEW